jgi:hypothetical protein
VRWLLLTSGLNGTTCRWVNDRGERDPVASGRLVDLVWKLKLPQLYELGRITAISVTVDSLPAHLCAVDGDTISLFKNGSGSLYFPIGNKTVTVLHDHVPSRDLVQPTPGCTSLFFSSVESDDALRAIERRIVEIRATHDAGSPTLQ